MEVILEPLSVLTHEMASRQDLSFHWYVSCVSDDGIVQIRYNISILHCTLAKSLRAKSEDLQTTQDLCPTPARAVPMLKSIRVTRIYSHILDM